MPATLAVWPCPPPSSSRETYSSLAALPSEKGPHRTHNRWTLTSCSFASRSLSSS